MREEGFILPVVMIVLFFFTAFVLFQIEQMQFDRDFLKERHDFIQENQMKKMAAADIIKKLQISEHLTEGSFIYSQAVVKFNIVRKQDIAEVTVSLEFDKDHQGQLIFFYDGVTRKIIRWVQ